MAVSLKGETIDEYKKQIKRRLFNIDYLLVGGSRTGVTINPIAFLVITTENVRLIPVNHSSSLDRLIDYMPDLIEKQIK